MFTTHLLKVFTDNNEEVFDIPDETDSEHEIRVNTFPKSFEHEPSS